MQFIQYILSHPQLIIAFLVIVGPVLSAIATIVRDLPASRTVLIEGHADQRGDDQYNFMLSFLRALAVQRELTTLGLRAARLRPLGFGRRVPRSG